MSDSRNDYSLGKIKPSYRKNIESATTEQSRAAFHKSGIRVSDFDRVSTKVSTSHVDGKLCWPRNISFFQKLMKSPGSWLEGPCRAMGSLDGRRELQPPQSGKFLIALGAGAPSKVPPTPSS
ncbi:hypothetical protein PoB_000901400 [Plakobranchus ocellatus]|uniref:Uncharacterized protein n=1 Tax=Plakobranchus ocellatus TaxID=259542 RepID=A0AAV3YKE6_9GAST|nr:hypothetical protein PoB_000901400 [Plakobranchus ocellatus]